MNIENIASQLSPEKATTGAIQPPQQMVKEFEQSLQQAQSQAVQPTTGETMQTLLKPLVSLNNESEKLGVKAMEISGSEAKPSDLLTLVYHTHELMFRTQLTANVANRSSDGVQQLFRQQA